MSRSGRRRGSKWDLDEGSEPREPSASRGSERHENNSKERVMAWDEDGDRRRMSPELDEWRHRRNDLPNKARGFSHRSTGSGSRSRSQSRSPPHNFRREPRFSDQNRIRSRVSAQLCRDLAAGRCRRGNHCPFLHDGAEQYDGRRHSESSFTERESRRRNTDGSRRSPDDIGDYPTRNARSVQCCNDFLKGKCRWGASCRYVHDEHVTDGFAKGSLDDVDRPADNDRRSRGTYPDSHQESPRGGEPVCKYFAAGNCRNGRYCRFSHQRRSVSPWRSRDGTLGQDSELDAKWGDPKWNDATDNSNVQVVGWDEVKTGIKGEGDNFSNRDMVNTSTWGAPSSPGEPMLRDENQSFQWTRHNERSMAVAEPNDAENIPVDMEMESPEGNDKPYNIFSPNLLSPPSPPISFPASSNDKTQEAALEKQFSTGLPQPKVSDDPYLQRNLGVGEGPSSLYTVDNNNSTGNGNSSNSAVLVQGFTLNDHNVGVQPVSNFNAVGQKQPSLPSYPSGSDAVQTPHNKTNIIGNKTAMEPNFVGPNTTAHGTSSHGNVTGEQLAQLSHLSASLSQLLENRQQLPQLSSLPDSSAPIPPVSAANFPTNQATVSMKQYDPLCVNIELENPNTGNSLFPTSTEEKSSSHGIMGIPEVIGDGVPVQAGLPNAKLDQSNSNKNGMAERIDKASEDGPVDDLAEDNGADDGRKVKDSKGVRPFKFALAEFVKELLRPTWKDGQVSKEVYKTIVKKAVDKVIDTFQEAHIPQTKEKIDQYLSFSRPKLTKLVQAYVEKYGKSKPKV